VWSKNIMVIFPFGLGLKFGVCPVDNRDMSKISDVPLAAHTIALKVLEAIKPPISSPEDYADDSAQVYFRAYCRVADLLKQDKPVFANPHLFASYESTVLGGEIEMPMPSQ